jgi:hypothetical protein
MAGVSTSANIGNSEIKSELDPIEKLTKLAALLKEGLISQEEFDAQKAKLLG